MFSYLYPDLYANDIFSIPYEDLRRRGITALLYDVDNTITPHFIKTPDAKSASLFAELNNMGFSICIVSNGRQKRVRAFMASLPYHYVYKARKPFLSGVNKALALCEALPGQAAIIGDQIFTDVLAGKRKKVYTILVKPISKKDELQVAIKRVAEALILHEYKKRGGYLN